MGWDQPENGAAGVEAGSGNFARSGHRDRKTGAPEVPAVRNLVEASHGRTSDRLLGFRWANRFRAGALPLLISSVLIMKDLPPARLLFEEFVLRHNATLDISRLTEDGPPANQSLGDFGPKIGLPEIRIFHGHRSQPSYHSWRRFYGKHLGD